MNINKAIIAGRLVRDPELKALPSGQNICSFSLATSENYTDKDGNKQEKTEFNNIVVFGKQAENCAKYLLKGQVAFIEGKITTRSWEKDGVKHYRTKIIADRVQFGQKKVDAPIQSESAIPEYPEDEINPDDVPF